MPAKLGGDHSFKFGYRWRSAHSIEPEPSRWFHRSALHATAWPNSADIYRDQNSVSHLNTNAFYVQDTYTKNSSR